MGDAERMNYYELISITDVIEAVLKNLLPYSY